MKKLTKALVAVAKEDPVLAAELRRILAAR
jgi:hypothetical protein